jgi:hypothetical protein
MTQFDAQDIRIKEIVGDEEDEIDFEGCVDKFYNHLKASLQLPCNVTGIEDFRWEERYVIGPGNRKEYEQLRKNQPSYKDIFELLSIERESISEWMMYGYEDITGLVRRASDGKEFYLGLAEIKAIDEKSVNYQLLDDYAVWFVNSR